MKNVFLETQRVLAFREAVGVVEDAEKGQPGLMLVWGNPGRGKTECAKEYAVRTGAIYIRTMQSWSERGMLATICNEINQQEPATKEKAKKIIIHELDEVPRTIMIDEADRLSIDNIEHLRDIHDLCGSPFILIGEPNLYGKVMAHGRIFGRVTKVMEFGPVVPEDAMMFGMKAADLKVNPEAGQQLCIRSNGDFRLLWRDMRDLEIMCQANKTDKVTEDMVKAMPIRKHAPTGGKRG